MKKKLETKCETECKKAKKDEEQKVRRKQSTPLLFSQPIVLGSSDEEVTFLQAQGPPPVPETPVRG